jgi:uncharacterized protein (DUF433 family)
MQLDEYFEFEACDRIRVKGTRIPIEIIVEEYQNGASPEEILRDYYPALNLEQVYATLTYYLHNKEQVEAYILRTLEADEAAYQEYLKQERPDVVKRLIALREQQQASGTKTS